MGGFAKDLLHKTAGEFAPYRIDYEKLKEKIREIEDILQEEKTRLDVIYNKAEEFYCLLDFNINRAVTFYEEKFEENVHSLQAVRKKWKYVSPATLPQLYAQLKEIAEGIRACLEFVEVNADAVRKILDKAESRLLTPLPESKGSGGDAPLSRGLQHGKAKTARRLNCRTRKMISQDEFLTSRLRPDHRSTSRLESLRVYSGLDRVVEEIRHRLDLLRCIETQWFRQGIIDNLYSDRIHARKNTLDLVVDLHSAVQSTVKKTKWYYGWLEKAKIDYEKEPIGVANTWGLIINNYNTFLYLANYYAVIPSANEYAQALGLSPASSGFLLAMAPLSALVSSLLYSLWSNRSFKQPLLFCTLLLITGNYIYAVALDYHSATMLFVGRLLVGFGGNRAVNRRYIADYVSVEKRTFHSAVFVAVGSLGMCLGPGSQILFNMLHFKIPYVGYTVSPLTAPGWIMVVLWGLFAIQVIVCFTEPARRYSTPELNSRGLLQPLMESIVLSSPDSRIEGELADGNLSSERHPVYLQTSKTLTSSIRSTIDTEGTIVCLWIYFVLKLAQEAFQTAAPMFTSFAFHWSDEEVGYLLAVIGFVVLPVNLMIGWIGNYIEDRLLSFWALILLAAGALLTVDWTADTPVSVHQYVLGALILFVSAQCLEAVCMALLSKVMPKSLSKGLWNSGLLSTEAGTFGRVIGSSLITVAGFIAAWMGHSGSVVELEAFVMIPCSGLIVLTLIIVALKWHTLVPIADRLGRITANEADDILKSELWLRNPRLRPICTEVLLAPVVAMTATKEPPTPGTQEDNKESERSVCSTTFPCDSIPCLSTTRNSVSTR